jgi:hypothetical protein
LFDGRRRKYQIGAGQWSVVKISNAMAALTIDLARDVESIAQWSEDFSRLEKACETRLPFSCFEWHMAWCRHFLCRDSWFFDEPAFCRVRNADG